MISKILIENFRSIERLEIETTNLNTFIGPNSAGKTNIFKALEILLGETYPTERAFTKDDFYQRDSNKTICIQIWFKDSLDICNLTSCTTRRKEYCSPLSLKLTHTKNPNTSFQTFFIAITAEGNEYWAAGEARDQIAFVYVPADRNLEKQMTISQWTLLGKILRKIDDNFRRDKDLVKKFKEAMQEPKNILESEFDANLHYKKFKETFIEISKENTKGLTNNFNLDLEIFDPLFFYKTIQIMGQENFGTFNAQELGSGVQNLILLSLFKTYAKLLKNKAILAIEEPEIYLYPQAQRQLYKNFRNLAYPDGENLGTQIFYTTHSPNFIDASKDNEIFLVRKNQSTHLLKRNGKLADIERDEIKLLTEFNPERNELFFAEKVILVEGETEKHSLPYILEKLDYPIEKENIAIIAANGKDKLKFLIKVCQICNIDWVALYDTDTDIKEKIRQYEGQSNLEEKLQKLKQQDTRNDILNSELNNLDTSRIIPLNYNFQKVLGLDNHKNHKWKEIQEARDYCRDIEKSRIPEEFSKIITILYPTSSPAVLSQESEPDYPMPF